MAIKEQPLPKSSIHDTIPVTRLGEYIASGDFQRAVDLLQHTSTASQNLLAHCLMQSAKHLCFAAVQTQSEIEHHKESLKVAENHQTELDDEIHAVLEVMEVVFAIGNEKPSLGDVIQSSNGTQHKLLSSSRRWTNIVNFFTGKPVLGFQKPLPLVDQLKQSEHSLEVYTLGTFQVYCNGILIDNWSSRKGTHIFKYLLMNQEHPIHKEVLMEQFWPDSDAESQRNNLNVAIYGLRQVLRDTDSDFSHVLFQNDCYFLNPEVDIWIDADAFNTRYMSAQRLAQQGKDDSAITEYSAAEMLYEGTFLPEDTYENWTDILRQKLQMDYLDTLDHLSRHYLETSDYIACVTISQKMIAVESCSEEAHARLMRCYRRQGQVHLALRQYDRYVKILETELSIAPTPAITTLYERIRAGEDV